MVENAGAKWRFDNGNGDFCHETLLRIAISPITTCEEIADPQKKCEKLCDKLLFDRQKVAEK